MVERLHWIIPDILAGMALPGRVRPLPDDLKRVKDAGIGAVATLTEFPLPEEQLEAAGLVGRHFPIVDFSIPTIVQVEQFVAFVDEHSDDGRPVAAHCYAGIGRTGTMIACYLVAKTGETTEDVLRKIRDQEPAYVQTTGQEAFIAKWEAHTKQK